MNNPTNQENVETIDGLEKDEQIPKINIKKKVLTEKQQEAILKMRLGQQEKLRLKREAKEKETAEKALQYVDKKIEEKLAKKKQEEEQEIVYVKRKPKKKIVYIDEDEEDEEIEYQPPTQQRQRSKTVTQPVYNIPQTRITYW